MDTQLNEKYYVLKKDVKARIQKKNTKIQFFQYHQHLLPIPPQHSVRFGTPLLRIHKTRYKEDSASHMNRTS